MHLELGFCKHYCVQLSFLIPDAIGKRKLERERPFATEFASFMNSCFNQYNASLVENVKVTQEVNTFSKKLIVFSQL